MTERTTHKFAAETDKVFKLMIHSLYENKEIFVRELVSNASDACDKLRYKAIEKPELLEHEELEISVEVNKAASTITFKDNGIGMTKDELLENLGTIARSGTQRFLEGLTGDARKDSQLIGQFGVGFYSVFMVADYVTVISQAAGTDKAHIWQSNGEGSFTIEDAPSPIGHGTVITLKLKPDSEEFLDKFRLKHIIKTYSNHVAFKITLIVAANGEDAQTEETVNEGKAIWLRDRSEITADEYNEFYKSISMLGNDTPLITFHNRAEGTIEYTNLLFVPSRKPFDLYHPDRETRVKLYIKKVLISEKLDVIPRYLRFLRGVVDSNDLPLNISRETIQNSSNVGKIKTSITKRVLKELAKMAGNNRADYLKFWENYGPVLKEGLCDGVEPRDEILEACLFQTSKDEQLVTLKEYKSRMAEGQKAIYFLIADSREQALSSPQIEGFVAKGYEVLLLTDNVDDFWTNVLFDYQSTPFRSVTKSGADLEEAKNDNKNADNPEDKKSDEDNMTALLSYIRSLLTGNIKDVRTTSKLADSPVCLAASENGMEIRFERFLVENKQMHEGTLKIFELNPKHKIIQKLAEDVAKVEVDSSIKNSVDDTIHMLFAQACIIEGEPLKDTKGFAKRINALISQSLAA